jgi:hypothetical protein
MQESVPARSSQPVTLFGHTAMGILDDAIREHLELIRRRGATDSEVQRLEDEAFGPPTRPDEADFPESEGARASANGGSAEEPEPPEEAGAHEDVTTLLPAEDVREPEPEAEPPGTGLEEPTGAHVTGDVDEPEGEPVLGGQEEPAEEPEQSEPVAEEHAIVDEQRPELAEDAATEFDEPEGGEEPPTFFDQAQEEGTETDLALSLDEERGAEEPPSEEHPAHEPEGAMPLEPPIESLDTVEHPFPDEITDTEEPHEEAAPSDEHAVPEEEPAPGAERPDEEGSDESDEDVLADTPDFLKDQPEDDELWFEQGEPKDFDF